MNPVDCQVSYTVRHHLIGTFDGGDFRRQSGPHRSDWAHGYRKGWYAAQSWNNVPESDGRRIMIGWMRGGAFPGMPFNQQMTVPRRVTLRSTEEGPRLFQYPVREIEAVHGKKHSWSNVDLEPGQNPLNNLSGKMFDIKATLRPDGAEQVGFNIRGKEVSYDPNARKLTALGKSTSLDMVEGLVKLRIVVDVASIEVFANGGRKVMSFSVPLDPNHTSLELFARGSAVQVPSVTVWECKSIWN